MIIYILMCIRILNMQKLKYGITSIKDKFCNDYIELLVLNISIGILYIGMIFYDMQIFVIRDFMFIFIIFAALMFITIQKSLQLYYKQKMLVKELDETKEDLARAENKIKIR